MSPTPDVAAPACKARPYNKAAGCTPDSFALEMREYAKRAGHVRYSVIREYENGSKLAVLVNGRCLLVGTLFPPPVTGVPWSACLEVMLDSADFITSVGVSKSLTIGLLLTA
jgi:hypothetical protein